jgi:hypothetical protein
MRNGKWRGAADDRTAPLSGYLLRVSDFAHPRDVLSDPDLDPVEKRTILNAGPRMPVRWSRARIFAGSWDTGSGVPIAHSGGATRARCPNQGRIGRHIHNGKGCSFGKRRSLTIGDESSFSFRGEPSR